MNRPGGWDTKWNNTLGRIVIFNDNAVLITKRKNKELYSLWDMISTKVRDSENLNELLDKAIEVQRHFFEIDKAKRISAIMKLTAMKGTDVRKSK